MEEAKIGGLNSEQKKQERQAQSLFPDTIPAVLSSDDLVLEIGKMALKVANAEKVIQNLVTKEKTLQEEKATLLMTVQGQEKKIEEFKNSNTLYQRRLENANQYARDLKEDLTKEREKTKSLKDELEKLTNQYITLKKENETYKEMLNDAQNAIDQLTEKLEALLDEMDQLRLDAVELSEGLLES